MIELLSGLPDESSLFTFAEPHLSGLWAAIPGEALRREGGVRFALDGARRWSGEKICLGARFPARSVDVHSRANLCWVDLPVGEPGVLELQFAPAVTGAFERILSPELAGQNG